MTVLSVQLSFAEPPPTTCGDFLSRINKKPKHLEFLGCKQDLDNQETKPLVATYRVKGIYAVAVETYFHKAFGMSRLIKRCCLWFIEPPGFISFNGEDGYPCLLWMSSEETLIRRRAEWSEIDYFYVTVERDTEEP